MDCEPEELQFLGFVGIYREAAKILIGWRRLFTQITAVLVLPLSLLFLAHVLFSHLLFSAIASDDKALDNSTPGSASESSALHRLAHDWSAYLLFKALYLLALLVLALLSTAAVVYSVASIYTARDLSSFSKVLSVVPKVWRRLMATFLWAFLILLAFNSAALLLFVAALLLAGDGSAGTFLVLFVLLPLYLVGLVWISVVWHLASVIAVLEDVRGLDAMKKARLLIKGKLLTAAAIFVMLNLCFGAVELGFRKLVLVRSGLGAWPRFGFGVLVLTLLCAVTLFGLVVQTVVYFVCKSYHHESIDKSSLADHLEVYLGEYVPLSAKDVQMEQFHV